ncbi:g2647 [Coccomyxa elongata]
MLSQAGASARFSVHRNGIFPPQILHGSRRTWHTRRCTLKAQATPVPLIIPSETNGANGTAAPAAPSPPTHVPELSPPPAAFTKAVAAGQTKAALSISKTFFMGILGGAFIGFGSFLALSVGGACPGLASTNPGLQKMVYGAFGLPFGLLLVLMCGAELFTGNTALVTASVFEGKASLKQLAKNWFFSYLGNFAGSLLMVTLVVSTGLLATASAPLNVAVAKTSFTFAQAFSRGILCNWLVSAAVYVANAASSAPGKAVAVWFPISAFVALGLEHSVANMFMVPLGIALGAKVSFASFLTANLLPVTLGNIVGGAVCIALAYAVCFGSMGQSLP